MAGRWRVLFDLSGDHGEVEGRFGLRRFTQSAGVISLSSVAGFVRAVITAKVFAVALGPSLVGVLAQLFNFSALLSSILPLGLTTGVSKLVAENSRDEDQVNRVVATSSGLALASGLAGAIVLAPLSGPLSSALTGSSRYALPLFLLIWSFPLYNLSGVVGYFLQGFAEIERLTRASILTAAFAVVALVPLTLAYGVTGVAVSVLLTSVAQALFYGFELWRVYAARGWRFGGTLFSSSVARELLLGYGWILLVASVLPWAAVLLVRTITLHTLGQFANGLYQVVFGLSTQYITVFLTWMAAYVFPRVVSEARSGKLNQLLNSGFRANLALMVPILVISIALRDPLIRIFYSQAFVQAAPLIPLQVFGDYLRVIGWSFAICLFAVGRTRSYLALIAAQNVGWMVLAVVLIPVWGLQAVPASYALSFVTYPVLGIWLVRHWVGAAPDRRGWLLAGLGAICVIGSLAPYYLGVLLAPVMPAVVYLLNRHELRVANVTTSP
jgi:O-antigen/teichoic acid export membrane protein